MSLRQTKTSAIDVQYATALALLSDRRIRDALNFLSVIGDTALTEALGSALSNAQMDRVKLMLQNAAADVKYRFIKGQEPKVLPKDDAFDLMDCLGKLMEDEGNKFYPYHPDFYYTPIGRVMKPVPGYPKFTADPNTGVSIASLVGNQSELNLSVLARIPGTIELPESVIGLKRENLGLPEVFETCIWRNRTLVFDAALQVKQLPVRVVNDSIRQTLVTQGLLPIGTGPEDIALLNLSILPVCNQRRGEEAADWQRMADLAYESLALGSVLKVLKARRSELDPRRSGEHSVEYTSDQWSFLQAVGINRKREFAPPVLPAEVPTEILDVRTMGVNIAGATPVTMKTFDLMLIGKKPWTFVGERMRVGQQLMDLGMPKQNAAALVWLKGQIEGFAQTKRVLDHELNARRFCAVLNGQWVKSFKIDTVKLPVGEGREAVLSFKIVQKEV